MSRKDEIIFRRKDGRREARYVKLSGKRKETIERVFADAKDTIPAAFWRTRSTGTVKISGTAKNAGSAYPGRQWAGPGKRRPGIKRRNTLTNVNVWKWSADSASRNGNAAWDW